MRDLFIDKRIVPRLGGAKPPAASRIRAQLAQARARLFSLFPLLLRCRRDIIAALAGIAAVAAIAINGLLLQPGPHPAPIFAIRPLPVVARDTTGAVAQLPRPRAPVLEAPKPDATHKAPQPVPLPRPRMQPVQAASHRDPIADLIDPTRQLIAVQRALNDFGYGPVKVSGMLDRDTREGIERFERDRNLAVTGQNSPQFRRQLSLATGRSLD